MSTNKAFSVLLLLVMLFAGTVLAAKACFPGIWYTVQCQRLGSEDATVREGAAIAIAGRGKEALPYLRTLLTSWNGKNESSQFTVLRELSDKMPDDLWDELVKILDKLPVK